MYEIKKRDFYPKEKYHKDKRYLIDIFRKLGAIETEESFLLPDEVLIPLKDSSIPDEVYDYFQLVWANEECTIDIEDVVGSHDYRNLEYDNWFKNFLINDVGSHILEKYLEDPKSVFDNPNHTFSAFEINGKFYVADGHHRFSTLYLHYHILKSQNKIPENFPKKIKGIKRVVPTNLEFVKKIVAFCVANNLYNEDEEGIIPLFQIEDSNPEYPVIRYVNSDILINPDSNLDEILSKINAYEIKTKKQNL